MRQRDAEPVHAVGAVGREARVVLADAARVAQHLREIEVAPAVVLLVLAQHRRDLGVRRILPEGVGRNDGIGRPLGDGIGQRQRHAAFRRFQAVRLADVPQALVVVAEGEAPPGLDRAGRRLVDHVDDALALAPGDLGERILERLGGSRVAVPLERHVGQATVRRDRRRLAFRALQRRHIGRRNLLRVRSNVALGELKLAHGRPPVGSADGGTGSLGFPDHESFPDH